MFGNKPLKDEVNTLRSKLETLEHSEFGKKLEKLQKSNHKSKKARKGLRKANLRLAEKLSKLMGIAIAVLAMSSGITISYIILYYKKIGEMRVNQPAVHEFLVDAFQNRLGDTIDRISLLAPGEEDQTMLKDVSDMRDQLSKICPPGGRCEELSKLTISLIMLVNEGKPQEASDQINKDMLPSSKNRFVESRAKLLQAAASFHPDGLCHNPDSTLSSLDEVIKIDSGLVAAINLEGVCLAQKAADSMKEGKLAESIKKIHAARRDNEFAFQFKPSRWSKVRFFNNKVWGRMIFLLYAVPLNKDALNKALQELEEYKDMEDFFNKSLKDIQECYSLSKDQATYLETEAEVHALEYTYYTSNSYQPDENDNDKHDEKAKAAKQAMIESLIQAMDKNLLKLRKLSSLKEAEEYFRKDVLLKPVLFGSSDKDPLNDQIEASINVHLARPK